MKVSFHRNLLSLLACLFAALPAAHAAPDVLYDNTAVRGTAARFGQDGLEFGEEIVLVGNGTYVVNEFQYEFFNDDPIGTNVLVTLRFYANDGLNGTPGTLLYQTDAYGIPNTGSAGYVITYGGLNVSVPKSFTWTVEFSSFGALVAAGLMDSGLDLYAIPTVGLTYDDYWERNSLGDWELRVPTPGNPPINFGCRVAGTYAGPAAINGQPNSQTGRLGFSTTFQVSAIGTETLTYQWKKGATAIPGATASTLTLNNLAFTDAGAYSVPERFATSGREFGEEIILAGNATTYTVTNFLYEFYGYGPDFAAGNVTVRLRFYANDGPSGVPNTLLFDSGSSPTLPSTGTAGSVINYSGLNVVVPKNFTWTVEFEGVTTPNGAGLLQAGLDLYTVPTVGMSYDDYWEKDVGGSWLLRAPSPGEPDINFGCQVAGTYSGPPTFTVQPQDTHAFAGQTAVLTSFALGTSPLTYQWRKGGSPISGATNNFLSLPGVTVADSGNYTVVAVNSDGTATSQTAALTVEVNTPPVASITAPANGATFNSGIDLSITASASDPDATYGSVSYVEFFVNGTRLSIDSTSPYSFIWTNLPVGTHVITATATDNVGATGSSTPVTITVGFDPSGTNTLVNQGSLWRYLDTGVDPGASWFTTGFSDTSWSAGLAQFGYGDGDETTLVDYGADANNRHVTTWFRHTWNVADPDAFAALAVKLLRDDGAVVYLNGVEIARQNLPAGPITASTLASSDVDGADEAAYFSTIVGKQGIVAGQNLLAVEVHQASASSPDLSFDLQLIALGGTAPFLVGCADLTADTDPGLCTAVVTYASPIAYDNEDGTVTVSCTPPSGSAFGKGPTTVTCTATDSDTLTGTCTFKVTVSDNQDPVANCPGNITTTTSPSGSCSRVVTFTATASDNCAGSTISCSPASGSTFSLGATPVTCTATDAAGNTDTCSFTVTVNDEQRPDITCPATQTAGTTPGSCSGVVTYPAPVATDNCTVSPTVVCNPASGSTFARGSTTVNCTATDAAGNTRSCSFLVVVNDTESPVITSCPGNLSVGNSLNACSSNVTFSASATDNCPGVTVACTPPSGTAFQVGTTTVTCTAVDTAGNSSAPCTFTVTVTDTQAPTIVCPANITVATVPGYSTNLTYSPTVTENCPTIHVVCTPPSGSAFANGTTTTVTCTATDDIGNVSTPCSFTVTVVDLGPACVTEVLYGFNELLGTVATDSSGSGINGTLVNGPIRTAGVVGEALRFDGLNDLVVANNPTALEVTGPLTFGCWYRPVNATDTRYLLVKGQNAGNGFSYRIGVVKGKFQYSWVSLSSTGARVVNTFATSRNVLAAGTWIHIAVSHQPGTSPTFYINGEVSPGGLVSGSATALRQLSGGYPFTVGGSSDGVSPINGAVDEVFVVSSLLNDLQLRSLTNGISPCARAPLTIATASPLADATVGATYTLSFAATGGSQPYTWSLAPASGPLPAGLALSAAGVLTGTPSSGGSYTFTVRVTDAIAANTDKAFTLLVNSPPPPVITTSSPLPNGVRNQPYSVTFAATGGVLPLTWSVDSGTLPAGLTLSPLGVLSGTPTVATTNTVGIRVTDSHVPTRSDLKSFVIAIQSPATGNYIVRYRFEELSGLNALDSSGNNITATLINGPTRVTSPTGGAIRFDGINDRVTALTDPKLNHTGPLTLAAWIFPETVADIRTIMIKGDAKAATSYRWLFRASGPKLQYYWVSGSKTENRYETVGNILAVGRWTHVAVVHTPGSTTPPQFYSNGVAVAGIIRAGSITALFGTTSNPFTVGSGSNGTQPFYGAIDEAVFLNTALGANAVASLMNPASTILPAAQMLAPIQLTIEQFPGEFLLRWNTQPGFTYRLQHRGPNVSDTLWLDLSEPLRAEGLELQYRDRAEDRFSRWYRVVTGE
ncbi:MAG: hypothetical protein RJA22_1100 [Verrucomicrobiota bacterium]